MRKSLEDVKRQLSRKYLGERGIHGVGINASLEAIEMHLEAGQEDEEKLREELEKAAAPYKIVLIPDEPPKIT